MIDFTLIVINVMPRVNDEKKIVKPLTDEKILKMFLKLPNDVEEPKKNLIGELNELPRTFPSDVVDRVVPPSVARSLSQMLIENKVEGSVVSGIGMQLGSELAGMIREEAPDTVQLLNIVVNSGGIRRDQMDELIEAKRKRRLFFLEYEQGERGESGRYIRIPYEERTSRELYSLERNGINARNRDYQISKLRDKISSLSQEEIKEFLSSIVNSLERIRS